MIYEGWTSVKAWCRPFEKAAITISTGQASQCPGAVFLLESELPSQCFHGIRMVCFTLGFRPSFLEFYFSELRVDAGKL